MTEIYCIRHSLRDNAAYDNMDVPLTAEGEKCALILADFWSFAKRQWNDFDYKFADGESLREVQTRNISVLEQILATSRNQKLAIGTHGTSLSTILNFSQPDFQFQDFQSLAGKCPMSSKWTLLKIII